MIQMTATGPTREIEAPVSGQGEIVDKLIPAPRVISARDIAGAAKAPARTAAQDTPDTEVSVFAERAIDWELAGSYLRAGLLMVRTSRVLERRQKPEKNAVSQLTYLVDSAYTITRNL
jgi:hypothetical protein